VLRGRSRSGCASRNFRLLTAAEQPEGRANSAKDHKQPTPELAAIPAKHDSPQSARTSADGPSLRGHEAPPRCATGRPTRPGILRVEVSLPRPGLCAPGPQRELQHAGSERCGLAYRWSGYARTPGTGLRREEARFPQALCLKTDLALRPRATCCPPRGTRQPVISSCHVPSANAANAEERGTEGWRGLLMTSRTN
jgi:hypothetical protein